ncbi:MAG: hypothetical protein EBU90_05065 [Proteobacteria bacterium]|nr:hypothetical protein [Pseudomonadota bacterium]
MKTPTKQEYFKILRSNPEYLSLLKKIPEAHERKKTINIVEYVAGNIYDALIMMNASSKQNPEILDKISEALKTGDGIIKENDGNPVVQNQDKKEK